MTKSRPADLILYDDERSKNDKKDVLLIQINSTYTGQCIDRSLVFFLTKKIGPGPYFSHNQYLT
jgi:hypothetical protein